MLPTGAAHSHQPIPALPGAISPVASSQGAAQHASPAASGHRGRGRKTGVNVHEGAALLGQIPNGPQAPAAGSKRKASELQQDDGLEVKLPCAMRCATFCQ